MRRVPSALEESASGVRVMAKKRPASMAGAKRSMRPAPRRQVQIFLSASGASALVQVEGPAGAEGARLGVVRVIGALQSEGAEGEIDDAHVQVERGGIDEDLGLPLLAAGGTGGVKDRLAVFRRSAGPAFGAIAAGCRHGWRQGYEKTEENEERAQMDTLIS